MFLEARSPSCFSNCYVLKLDGQPIGEYSGRWFSEEVEVNLRHRRRLLLRKAGWLGSQFFLYDLDKDEVLAEADRAGIFTSAWELRLSNGSARLVSAGVFNTGFHVVQQGRTTADVNRIGICEGGWSVESDPTFEAADLVFIGLIFHTILKRRASSSGATAGAAGS